MLVEAVWVLSSVYRLGARAIATAIEMLLDHARLTVQEPEVVAGALRLSRARPALSFSDCLVLEITRRAGHLPWPRSIAISARSRASNGGAWRPSNIQLFV